MACIALSLRSLIIWTVSAVVICIVHVLIVQGMVGWTDQSAKAARIAGQTVSSAVESQASLPADDVTVAVVADATSSDAIAAADATASDAVTAADATAHPAGEATEDVIGVGFPSKRAGAAVAFVLA